MAERYHSCVRSDRFANAMGASVAGSRHRQALLDPDARLPRGRYSALRMSRTGQAGEAVPLQRAIVLARIDSNLARSASFARTSARWALATSLISAHDRRPGAARASNARMSRRVTRIKPQHTFLCEMGRNSHAFHDLSGSDQAAAYDLIRSFARTNFCK